MKTIDIVTVRELLCNDIPIRTMNHQKKKQPFVRILPSDYADGEKELAGDFFTKSMILKYKPAFSSYNKLCGK